MKKWSKVETKVRNMKNTEMKFQKFLRKKESREWLAARSLTPYALAQRENLQEEVVSFQALQPLGHNYCTIGRKYFRSLALLNKPKEANATYRNLLWRKYKFEVKLRQKLYIYKKCTYEYTTKAGQLCLGQQSYIGQLTFKLENFPGYQKVWYERLMWK